MTKIDRSTELLSMLEERRKWHVLVLEYGATHARMQLALHPKTYPRCIKVTCIECLRFDGDLNSGPYRLVLEPSVDVKGGSLWTLRATDGSFRLGYGWVSMIAKHHWPVDE